MHWVTRTSALLLSGLVVVLASTCGDPRQTVQTGPPATDLSGAVVLRQSLGVGATGEAAQQFGAVGTVRLGPDGSVYVLDRLAATIRRFSPGGRLLNSIGRGGSGPGRFEVPFTFDIVGDTLLVWDMRLWRISGFLLDGTLLWTARVEPRQQSGWIPSVALASREEWLYLDQEIRSPAAASALT